MYLSILCVSVLFTIVLGGHPHNLAWSGGPLHLECEHSAFLTQSSKYVRENVIVIKAVTFKDKVYVSSPRWKRGVLATVWMVTRGRHGIELQPFPDQSAHNIGDCGAIQNAIDIHLDYLGNLWVLDSGTVETLEHPRCTCPPKVVVINIPRKKLTKHFPISPVEPTSLLHNIVVEYKIGKAFVYISDSSRGAIIVHDTSSDAQWAVLICAPTVGMQLAIVKRSPAHSLLIIVRLHQKGLLELDTAALKRKNALSPLRVYGENSKPMLLVGFDSHHVYLRHAGCADVLAWNTREVFNSSDLQNIHSPGPGMTPTSVTAEPHKHVLIILDSNFAETVNSKTATYHRITFIDKW